MIQLELEKLLQVAQEMQPDGSRSFVVKGPEGFQGLIQGTKEKHLQVAQEIQPDGVRSFVVKAPEGF